MSHLAARALAMLAYVIFNLDAASNQSASDGVVAGISARARAARCSTLCCLVLALVLGSSRLCRMHAVAVSRPFDRCYRTIAHVGKTRRLLEGMEAAMR